LKNELDFAFFKFKKWPWSKMAKIVISNPFTGNFFQTENTKCTIFEQKRLIACLTQEKKPKNVLVRQVMAFKRLVKIMLFAKSYGSIHDTPSFDGIAAKSQKL
jgi:hypothetical protein